MLGIPITQVAQVAPLPIHSGQIRFIPSRKCEASWWHRKTPTDRLMELILTFGGSATFVYGVYTLLHIIFGPLFIGRRRRSISASLFEVLPGRLGWAAGDPDGKGILGRALSRWVHSGGTCLRDGSSSLHRDNGQDRNPAVHHGSCGYWIFRPNSRAGLGCAHQNRYRVTGKDFTGTLLLPKRLFWWTANILGLPRIPGPLELLELHHRPELPVLGSRQVLSRKNSQQVGDVRSFAQSPSRLCRGRLRQNGGLWAGVLLRRSRARPSRLQANQVSFPLCSTGHYIAFGHRKCQVPAIPSAWLIVTIIINLHIIVQRAINRIINECIYKLYLKDWTDYICALVKTKTFVSKSVCLDWMKSNSH